ncbi:MAG: hypothetical protein WD733_04655 [Bryobacterales bacterium]
MEAAADLSANEQDELAERILDEVSWERGDKSEGSPEKLRRLVKQGREDIEAGRVRELRPEDI